MTRACDAAETKEHHEPLANHTLTSVSSPIKNVQIALQNHAGPQKPKTASSGASRIPVTVVGQDTSHMVVTLAVPPYSPLPLSASGVEGVGIGNQATRELKSS